jgi:hypothetical protein
MMDKAVKITVGFSTNPAVSGRYYLDVRNVTAGANRQLTLRVLDQLDAESFLSDFRAAASKASIAVTVEDETGELNI